MTIQTTATQSRTFLWFFLLCCTKVAQTFESVSELVFKCDHSNESYSEQNFALVLFI